jgi:hypothetical protein
MCACTYYFVFGDNHKHPKTGELMREYWIEVLAPSITSAKTKFNDEYGGPWQSIIHESVFPTFNRRYRYSKGQYARYEVDNCD